MPSQICEVEHTADEIVDTLAKHGLGFDVKLALTPRDIADAIARMAARQSPNVKKAAP